MIHEPWTVTEAGTGNIVVTVSETTAEDLDEAELVKDKNVSLVQYLAFDKPVRYILKIRKTRTLPRKVLGPFYATVHYESQRKVTPDSKRLQLLYHDSNVRLLAFGEDEKERDYMIVMRKIVEE